MPLERFLASSPVADLHDALARDGAVIVEGLLSSDAVGRINDEVEAEVGAADPDAEWFNPVMNAFNGAYTRVVSGVPGISPTFAVEAMCHPLLLELCDRILLPSCARYHLNIGQILERGPGSEEQWLHRDEEVWSDVPRPFPTLQVASVIALSDFTADNGGTRVVPGSHQWPDRLAPRGTPEAQRRPIEDHEIECAVMPAGSAVVYVGGTVHGGGANTADAPRRGAHLSFCLGWLRTEENNYLSTPPRVAATLPRRAQELLGYAVHDAIGRGGGFLGQVRGQDPVVLLERGELQG